MLDGVGLLGCGRGIMDALVQRLKVVLDKITAARARLIASAKVSTVYNRGSTIPFYVASCR